MNNQEKTLYMEVAAAKLMNWLAIEDNRRLTGIENIMSQCIAQDYDAKVAQGFPDVMATNLSITSF